MLPRLSELLALPSCVGCGAVGGSWCDDCAALRPDVRWHRLANTRWLCTAFPYTGPIQTTIIRWKEQRLRTAEEHVGRWFGAALHPLLAQVQGMMCVPIPSPPRNDRLRGAPVLHDLLTSRSLPVCADLVSARPRRDQAGLGREDRLRNLDGAFAWSSKIDRPLLLVDDVVTSGATMRAAMEAVHRGGGDVRAAFGLARRGLFATVHAPDLGIPLS
jgi:predicted amidophosphoribosyltransferase